MYTKEQIEEKRRQAILRQQQKHQTTPVNNSIKSNQSNNSTPTNPGLSAKNFYSNQNSNTPGNFKNLNVIKHQSPSQRFNPMKGAPNYFEKKLDEKISVTCQMITNERFAVDSSKYCQELNDLCKIIQSRAYDSSTKTWSFNLNDYTTFCEKVVALKNVAFKPLPAVVLKTFRNLPKKSLDLSKVDLSKIDKSLLDSLYPFQKEGVQYGISKNGRCLIADDMGLGKTRQALAIADYYRDEWPLIIVTPSSVRYQWSEAIFEHLPSVPTQHVQNIMNNRQELEDCKIFIISYDILSRRIDELTARRFGVMICDESHYLKSGTKVKRYEGIQRLSQRARRVILLTGTPALSRPIELYSQINLLIPNFMKHYDYGERYCAGVQTSFCFDCTGASNLKELELFLKASCVLRRLKSDVMEQLPSKIRQKIILDPNLVDQSRKAMKEASQQMSKSNLTGGQKQAAMFAYYQETACSKEKAVCNYISDLLENDEKFLVFGHHTNLLDAVTNLLIKKDKGFMRIDGKTSALQRKENVDRFQSDEKCKVAVLSIMAANAGITLTAARLVVFAELSWNPGILCQAEDRVHRIGQTSNVVIRYLVAKNTADDYMWPAIQNKINVLNQVGLDQNFDLNHSNTTVQATSNQETLDKYFETDVFAEEDFKSLEIQNQSSGLNSDSNANKSQSSNFQELLDEDDAAFDEIDLDSIT